MSEEHTKGSVVVVKKFIDRGSKSVGMIEMKEFWNACSEEEKLQFTREAASLS